MTGAAQGSISTARQSRDIGRRLDRVDWDFPSYVPKLSTKGIHALHWYPAPFPPALPSTLLDILGAPGQSVLDPFSGSGVTVLEAWMRGFSATGIDVNEFAVELARAKVGLLIDGSRAAGARLADEFSAYARDTRSRWNMHSAVEVVEIAGMDPDAINWFSVEVLRDVGMALEWIRERDGRTAEWLWAVLSATLHGVSNLRDVHYTYIVDRSRTRVPPRAPADLVESFTKHLVRVCSDAEMVRSELSAAGVDLVELALPDVRRSSATSIGDSLDGPYDLVITSPPYFGMNDYVRSQYLSWVVRPWDSYAEDLAGEAGQRRSRRSSAALARYLEDMRTAFLGVHGLLTDGGLAAIVMGASRSPVSAAADPIASVERILGEIGFEWAWRGTRRGGNRKINNSPRCVEHIWVLSK